MISMKLKTIISVLLCAGVLNVNAQTKYVGGDLSMLPKYEQANVAYYDYSGNRINGEMLDFFRDKTGFNIVRVRLFVNPSKTVNGVCQDLDYVKALGKRIKDSGMKFMLDFQYSDTWADPSNQWTPAAWTSLSDDALYTKIYDYTKESLQALKAYGATPDFIQTGNEISYGMLWGAEGTPANAQKRCNTSSDANWNRFKMLLTKASQACREVCPDAKVIIHSERSGQWSSLNNMLTKLSGLDYDIVGLSYYPNHHGAIATLKNTLSSCHSAFPAKDIMIVETGYYNNWYNTNDKYQWQTVWEVSPAGQKAFLDELVAAIKDLSYVSGLVYWFPEENPSGNNNVYTPWFNHGLFNPSTGMATLGLYALQGFVGKSTTPSETQTEKTYYILGNGDEMGNWTLPPAVKLEKNAKGMFYKDINPTGEAWLCLCDGQTSDWDVFNGTYRLSTTTNNELLETGKSYQLVRGAGNVSMKVLAGSYRLTFDSATMMLYVTEPVSILAGDANGDGTINGTDLVALANIVLGLSEEIKAADVNGDGTVNGTDLVVLANIVLTNGAAQYSFE